MKIGKDGIEIIKKWEGLKLTAYKDSVGIPTIGIGTIRVACEPVKMGMTCTVEQAEQWLIDHIAKEVEPCINAAVTVPLNQYQFDALCSFIYNLGCANFKKSTLLRLINEKDFIGASKEFSKWTRANGKKITGLINRRKDEAMLFGKFYDPESSV